MIAWVLTLFTTILHAYPETGFSVEMNSVGEYWLELFSFFYILPGIALIIYGLITSPRGQVVLAALVLCLPLVSAAVPVIQDINITENIAWAGGTMSWYVNITDADSDNVSIEYILYKNNVVNQTGNFTNGYKWYYNESAKNFNLVNGNVYQNYTSHIYSNIYKWQTKMGVENATATQNNTLTDLCGTYLNFRLFSSTNNFGNSVSRSYCYNGTDYNLLRLNSVAAAYGSFDGPDTLMLDGNWSTFSVYDGLNLRWSDTVAPQSRAAVLFEDGLYQYAPQGFIPGKKELINLSNIILGDNWTLAVRAYDYYNYSSWVNATFNVTELEVYNCSAGNIIISLYNRYESDTTKSLNSTIDISMNYTINNATTQHTYNDIIECVDNCHICYSNLGSNNLTLNTYIKYDVAEGFTHRYYMQNWTYTNETINITLYNFNNTVETSDLKITARQTSNYAYYPNIVAKLLRFYVGEGIWRVVQMDKSGDYGLLHFNIIEEDTDYRLVFLDGNNHILKSTDTLKFVCTDGLCDTTVALTPYDAADSDDSVNAQITWNSTTKVVTIDWSDPDLEVVTRNIKVTKPVFTGTVTICSATQTGVSGTYDCNLSAYSGDVKIEIDGSPNMFSEWLKINKTDLADKLPVEEQVFWSVGLILTSVGAGLASPVLGMIYAIIAVIVVLWLGILEPITVTLIGIIAAVGIIIGFKVKT